MISSIIDDSATASGQIGGSWQVRSDEGECDGGGGVVAEMREPGYAGLASKPGDLAFGEIAGSLLNLFDSGLEGEAALEIFAQLSVADELEGFCGGGNVTRKEFAHLVEPASGEHGFDARVNSGVKRWT